MVSRIASLLSWGVGGLAVAAGTGGPDTVLSPVAEVAARLDAVIDEGLRSRGVVPSARATDGELVRRLSLDLRGVVPSPEEVIAFESDPSPANEKWGALVSRYLESREHASYFARLTTDVLLSLSTNREVLPEVLTEWLEDAFARNRPWDEMTRDLLLDCGVAQESGPANFLIRWGFAPEEIAGATARVFLGVQIQCAQCHDHPNGEWTREDFWGFAGFFGRTKLMPMRIGASVRDYRVVDRLRGEAAMDVGIGKVQVAPKYLRGEAYADERGRTRREALADSVTAPGNPWFARAAVNRTAGLLLGRGFVDPVDDFSRENPPSHPPALDLLAADFAVSGYDLKRSAAIVSGTRAYRRSSRSVEGNERDLDGYSHAALRPLNAHQVFGAVVSALGLSPGDPAFDRLIEANVRSGVRKSQLRKPPEGEEEIAIDESKVCGARKGRPPLPAIEHVRLAFLQMVRSAQAADDPDQRLDESVAKALLLLNGALVNEGVEPSETKGPPTRTVDRVHALEASVAEKVDRLYLAALSRRPSSDERARAVAAIGPSPGADALSDLLWGLLNSAEFAYNH